MLGLDTQFLPIDTTTLILTLEEPRFQTTFKPQGASIDAIMKKMLIIVSNNV